MFEKWIILKRNQTPNKLLKKKLITGVKSRTIKLKFNLKLKMFHIIFWTRVKFALVFLK